MTHTEKPRAVILSADGEGIGKIFELADFECQLIQPQEWNQYISEITSAEVVVLDEVAAGIRTVLVDQDEVEGWLSQGESGPAIVVLENDDDHHFDDRTNHHPRLFFHHETQPLLPFAKELRLINFELFKNFV